MPMAFASAVEIFGLGDLDHQGRVALGGGDDERGVRAADFTAASRSRAFALRFAATTLGRPPAVSVKPALSRRHGRSSLPARPGTS